VTLGYLLKRYRLKRGWSQRRLAREAQVRQALISELETEKRQDTRGFILMRLAKALGITLGQLLGQEQPPDPWTHLYTQHPGEVATYRGEQYP
jgi:transcriptional regulator with XRE-family HTH domain